MKLIIDIEPRYCKNMHSDVKGLYYEAIDRIIEAVSNGIPYDERLQGDLINREDLKKALHNFFDGKVIDEPAYILRDVFCYIEGAPSVNKCNNCDLYFKAMTKEEQKGDAKND